MKDQKMKKQGIKTEVMHKNDMQTKFGQEKASFSEKQPQGPIIIIY